MIVEALVATKYKYYNPSECCNTVLTLIRVKCCNGMVTSGALGREDLETYIVELSRQDLMIGFF